MSGLIYIQTDGKVLRKEAAIMKKIALVYTSASDLLLKTMQDAVRAQFDEEVEIREYLDPSVIDEAKQYGYVTEAGARKFVNMFEKASAEGADIIVCSCSSMGDVGANAKALYNMMGQKFMGVDEGMAAAAVQAGKVIGLIGTVNTTFAPSTHTIERAAAAIGKDVHIIGKMVDVFNAGHDEYVSAMLAGCREIEDKIDCFVFAQASMYSYADEFKAALKKPCFFSVDLGAAAIRKALEA